MVKEYTYITYLDILTMDWDVLPDINSVVTDCIIGI